MSITFSPESRQVFGFFLGFSSLSDIEYMTHRLHKDREYIDNPFVLISAFLELEKHYRFLQVDAMIDALRTAITKSQEPTDVNHQTQGHQGKFYQLFTQVDALKTQLKIWTVQFDKIIEICPFLPMFKPPGEEGFLLSPDESIQALKEAFEERIMRCEGVQEATSLAFQKV